MSGQETPKEGARRRAAERVKNSPDGLRATAKELLDGAHTMSNANDKATMLRLASQYQRRAQELDERLRSRVAK
jgi:hypothetical protein